MKTAILTGGTGFLGFWLLKELIENNVFVYVIVRKNSKRRKRLNELSGIEVIELNMDEISQLPSCIHSADAFYHLAWEGGRNDFSFQVKNIQYSVDAMEAALRIGIKQFIMTGSQAEYGICHEEMSEETPVNPITAYGVCKLASFQILDVLSKQIKLPLTWVRVFSVYGEGDNPNTLISYLLKCFRENSTPHLTSGNHLWDFLYAKDAAVALYLLGNKKISGTYNLAFGESRPLKEFIMEARDLLRPDANLIFESDVPYLGVELNANVGKIKRELGWFPQTMFKSGISKITKQ
jgi:nucleoside-diphosphate-sugar epimerase